MAGTHARLGLVYELIVAQMRTRPTQLTKLKKKHPSGCTFMHLLERFTNTSLQNEKQADTTNNAAKKNTP